MNELEFLKVQRDLVYPEVIQYEYRENWALLNRFIPIETGLPKGVRKVKAWYEDVLGRAVRYDTGTPKDIPTVGRQLEEREFNVAQWVIGADWTREYIQILQTLTGNPNIASQLGVPLDDISKKIARCRQIIEIEMNKAVIYSDTNFQGFVGNSLVPVENLVPDIYALTGTAFYDYIRNLVHEFLLNTGMTSSQLTMLVCPDLWFKLNGFMDTLNPTVTYYQALTASSPGDSLARPVLLNIFQVEELSSANLEANGVQAPATNRDRIILYNNDVGTLARKIDAPEILDPYLESPGLSWVMPYLARSSEVIIKRPMRIKYYTHQID